MPKTRRAGSPKYRKRDNSWHFQSLQVRSSLNIFWIFLLFIFAFFIAMNEVNSKR